MTELIDPADLELLATSFVAALTVSPFAADAESSMFELGWADVLEMAPVQGARVAFNALGNTGSAASLLDDVCTRALGLPATPRTAFVLPAPQTALPTARRSGHDVVVDGLVTSRIDRADTALVGVTEADGRVCFFTVDATLLRSRAGGGLDPDRPIRRTTARLAADQLLAVETEQGWDAAVSAARAALAHQLIGASRWMLEQARQHALDRVQFNRPVASFQAIRHKLAESLVLIEGAAAIAGSCVDGGDPLVAMVAKSLAGKAARMTAGHVQQTLAGIGFTTDHQFHRWLKRTLVLDTLFGSAGTLPAEIGRELLARGAAPRLVEL